MLPPRLLVIHDPRTRRKHNIPKLSTRQQIHNPLLHILELDIEARRNDTRLVDAPVELNDDFAVAVVVDFFEFANVAFLRFVLASLRFNRLSERKKRGECDEGLNASL